MKNKQTHLQYALFAALATIILGVVLYIANMYTEKWANWVALLPLLIFIMVNANAYSKANDHYVTYGNVFTSGFKLSLVMGAIMSVWGFVSLFLFPEMKDKIIEVSEQQMLDQGQSEEQIEMAMSITRKYFGVFAVIMPFLMYLFWGTIFSLIGGAVAKKKGERPFNVQ